MTEDTYTEAQIREANFRMLETVFEDDPFTDTTDALITELQRPSWMPDEGEVIVDPSGKLFRFGFAPNPPESAKFRRQNLKEHGQAVKALRDYVERRAGKGSYGAKEALKAFNEVVK